MAVESTVSQIQYDGDGSTTVFPIPFLFLDNSHIVVQMTVGDASTNPTDYTITGAGVSTGGTLTFASAPDADAIVFITRVVPITQEVKYQSNSAFPAKTQEGAYDKLTMIAQQLDERLDRAIQYPLEPGENVTMLPAASDRASTVVTFDSNGKLVLSPLPAGIGAGDLRVDQFIADTEANPEGLPTYTAGVTASLTLSRAPGSAANAEVHFGAAFQGPDTIESIVDRTLTFSSPIPLGVKSVYVRTGTTLSLSTPSSDSITDDMVSESAGIDAAKLSFLQLGTGAVRRTIQAKSRDRMSVCDFMTLDQIADVVGRTWTVDVTAAIQAAEDAAYALGKDLDFEDGIYYINATGITKRSGVSWWGRGSKRSILKGTSGTSAPIVRGGAIADVVMLHIGFDFSAAPFVAFMRNVYFDSFTDSEIAFCDFQQQAIGFQADGGSNFSIHLNTFYQKTNETTPRTAYGTTINESIWISNNTSMPSDYSVTFNKSQNAGTAFNGSNVTLIGNRIWGWGYGSGITTEQGTFDYTIVGNECVSGTGVDANNVPPAGIELWSNRSTVVGNRCNFNAGMGISVGGSPSVVVGNMCVGNGTYSGSLAPARYRSGIILRYVNANINGNSSVVVGNICYDIGGNQQYGLVDDSASCGGSVISGNFFAGVNLPVSLQGTRYDFRGPKLQQTVTGQAGFTIANGASGGGNAGVPVSGAQIGDVVRASVNQNIQGLDVKAWVTSTNTVAYTFYNATGGSVMIPNFSITLMVEKPINYATY